MIIYLDLSPKDYRLARTLGDKTRWDIVCFLADGPKTVSQIAKELDQPMTNISHALSYLKREDCVTMVEHEGKLRYYSLDGRLRT